MHRMSRKTRRPNPYNAQKWTSRAISTSAVQRIGSCADALDQKGIPAHQIWALTKGAIVAPTAPLTWVALLAPARYFTVRAHLRAAAIPSTTADGRQFGDEGRRWRPAHRPPAEIPQSIHGRQRHHRKRPSVAFAKVSSWPGRSRGRIDQRVHLIRPSPHPTRTTRLGAVAGHRRHLCRRSGVLRPKRLVPDRKRRRRRLLDGRWVRMGRRL